MWTPLTERERWSTAVFARMVRKPKRRVQEWRARGTLPWWTADETAVALGFHPLLIWGDKWLELDRGVIEGSDTQTIKLVENALTQIGAVMETGEGV
jgi:hypothetical protein